VRLPKELGALDGIIMPGGESTTIGKQLQSFETELLIPELGEPPLRAVFIRAPSIESVGSGVQVLARLPDGSIMAARQRNLLAATFHPELAGDFRLHRYFLQMAAQPPAP